jgi:DNA-binding Xre family transcriptional regulator|tara:strand:+ start:658 stop:963 length:306 start_codon:yes stop_codon:yes gene_type:complete
LTKESAKSQTVEQQNLVNKLVCRFITENFLSPPRDQYGKEISQNEYSEIIDVSSSVLSKMKNEKGYNIPLSTINRICEKEKISLSDFFQRFEKRFPEAIIK